MRIVLDTNVVLSACLKPEGLEAQTLNLALEGKLTACLTPEVWAEYQEVLLRPKFLAFRTAAEALLQAVYTQAEWVVAGDRITVAPDDDDNRFLECAAAANAEFLVTGNLRHFPAEHGGTQVVNARCFISDFGASATPGALK